MDTDELFVLICGFIFIELTFASLFNVGKQAEYSKFLSQLDKVGTGYLTDKLWK